MAPSKQTKEPKVLDKTPKCYCKECKKALTFFDKIENQKTVWFCKNKNCTEYQQFKY